MQKSKHLMRIIIKNSIFIFSYFLISLAFAFYDYNEKTIGIDCFLLILVLIYLPAYFIVKGNDYETPWLYIGIGVIVTVIFVGIDYLIAYRFVEKNPGLDAWVVFFSQCLSMVLVPSYLFLVDCCISAIHTFKEKRKKTRKITTHESEAPENGLNADTQAD